MDYLRQYFNIEKCIGKGAFGQVLVTSPIQNQTDSSGNNKQFAVKCILPVIRPQRLASELRHLRDLGGRCNVVKLHAAQLHKGSLFIVMDLIDHEKFSKIVPEMDHGEIVMYMKNLLIALQHVHSQNIMHRDIKPGNFLYNRRLRKFLLVDFGLATQIRAVRPAIPGENATASTPKQPIGITPKQTAKIINFGSPAKRSLPVDTNTSIQMFKKLRVSNNDEPREPVKLTVGAYESPVTTNDGSPFVSGRQQMNDDHKFSTPKIPRHPRCYCYGRPRTCPSCMSKPEPNASRSGTPGFKAPETLLRYPYQTTAVDMWSAGVIMFCLLAGHGPLFRDVDDMTSLCEMITLLGSHAMKEAAKQMGIRITLSPERQGHDLQILCQRIRTMKKECDPNVVIPDEAFDLLRRMLDPSPFTRITASEALQHHWLQSFPS